MIKEDNEGHFWNIIMSAKAVINGHFKFTEKYHTKYYINTDILFQSPEFVNDVVSKLSEFFKDLSINYVITANYRSGAIMAHNIGELFNAQVLIFKRNEGVIKFKSDLNIEGKVLIIDDGISTGNTIKQLLTFALKNKLEIVGIGLFINRYIGDIEKDFGAYNIKSILSLKNTTYECTNIEKHECEQCTEYESISKDLKNEIDIDKQKELLEDKERLKLRSAYKM